MVYFILILFLKKEEKRIRTCCIIDSLQYPSIVLSAIPTLTPLIIPKCYEESAITKPLSKWRPWDLGSFRARKQSADLTLSTDLIWLEHRDVSEAA